MRLSDYDHWEGKQVWLEEDELELLIENAASIDQEIAIALAGKCGLRRSEIRQVTYEDFKHAPDGFLRVWEDYSKGEKYRETPVPDELAALIRGRMATPSERIVDVTGRTINRWIQRAAETCAEETGDDRGWQYVRAHDLRRTWASILLWDKNVMPIAVMEFGGWDNWKTFKDHYMGEMSPAAAQRERMKIFENQQPENENPLFSQTNHQRSPI